MDSRNGAWAAFDRDNTRELLYRMPFSDFGAMIDPPTEDVTAHVLEMLAALGEDESNPAVARGLEYLRATQKPWGSWYGRWGVNHIYGTWCVISALVALVPSLTRACRRVWGDDRSRHALAASRCRTPMAAGAKAAIRTPTSRLRESGRARHRRRHGRCWRCSSPGLPQPSGGALEAWRISANGSAATVRGTSRSAPGRASRGTSTSTTTSIAISFRRWPLR